jgi:hypothetical protein
VTQTTGGEPLDDGRVPPNDRPGPIGRRSVRILASLGQIATGAILVAVGVFALASDAIGLTVLGTVLAALVAIVGVLVLAQAGTLIVLRAVRGHGKAPPIDRPPRYGGV